MKPNPTQCCRRCLRHLYKDGSDEGVCGDVSCPCHTPEVEAFKIHARSVVDSSPTKSLKEAEKESKFEAMLAVFVAFVEDEAQRIDEEKHGFHRRDGGRKMKCTLFLQQLLSKQREAIIGMVPGEKNGDELFIGDDEGRGRVLGFNACREELLSKLKEL